MSRLYNMVGALAWITTRDPDAAKTYNEEWEATNTELGRIAAVLFLADHIRRMIIDEGGSEKRDAAAMLVKAKGDIVDTCRNSKLEASGRTASDQQRRPVPATSWIDAEIDEVESSIGDGSPTWVRIRFKPADLQILWHPGPLISSQHSKKATGPRPTVRDPIAQILDQDETAYINAFQRGEDPPPRQTAKQVQEKLRQKYGLDVPIRTVTDNISKINGNIRRSATRVA